MAIYELSDVLANNDVPAKNTYSLDDVLGNDAPVKPRRTMQELSRQLGLTVRHGVQGLADTAGIFSDPLAASLNAGIRKLTPTTTKDLITGNKPFQFNSLSNATKGLLDYSGLPVPENSRERNVAEASKLLAGSGGIIKSAALAPKALSALAARPALQASSAVGAGYAGSEAREQGGGGAEQFAASLLGGLGAPLSVAGLDGLVTRAGQTIKNSLNHASINNQVTNKINQAGIDIQSLPNSVQTQIRQDVQKAVKTNNVVSPDALRRLADYRAVDATPLRGNLTLSPIDITRDKNLAKLGANSTDTVANSLANIQNKNNKQLINGLNNLGANTADDMYGAGSKIISTLQSRDNGAKGIINQLYAKARTTDGRSANIDPHAFSNQANDLLDDALLGGKLPVDVRNKLNSIAQGKTPLTVDVAEQFKTNIGALQRASNDPAERMALGKVRQALDGAPMIEGQEIGKDAISAFNQARKVNAAYMGNVEKTPALQAVRDGVEPDKFVNQFIIGSGNKSNVMDVAMLKKNIKGDKEATNAIRGQILAHLKNKGVGGSADEVANFSPSSYNKAVSDIGEHKLRMFFNQSEIDQLKRIGRVASYENFQPKGSAVNNSNSAAAMFTHLVDGVGKFIPFGEAAISKPINNIATSINSRKALNASNALLLPNQRKPISPALFPLGLLSAEQGS